MTPPRREFLGSFTSVVTRQRAYRIANGLELDNIDHFEVTRRRVFYDDVVAITYHQTVGTVLIPLFSILAVMMLLSAVLASSEPIAVGIFVSLALLFLIPVVIRALRKIDIITVFGKRTKITMRFSFRKERARQLYNEITASVRTTQQRLAAEIAAQEPPPAAAPAPDYEMPPSEPPTEES